MFKNAFKSNELIAVENLSYKGAEPVVAGEELISIHGVDLSYKSKGGTIKALDNINFNIYRGEFICALGSSGCGNSTLLKILAGFLRPTSGSVKLSGSVLGSGKFQKLPTNNKLTIT